MPRQALILGVKWFQSSRLDFLCEWGKLRPIGLLQAVEIFRAAGRFCGVVHVLRLAVGIGTVFLMCRLETECNKKTPVTE